MAADETTPCRSSAVMENIIFIPFFLSDIGHIRPLMAAKYLSAETLFRVVN